MSRVPTLLVSALVLLGLSFGLAGCNDVAPTAGSVEAAPPPAGGFAGSWEVKGTTEDLTRGDTRTIVGRVIMTEKDGVYSAHSELSTEFPSRGGPVDAEVLGNATGTREGNTLSGTAETQLVIQTVPGVNTDFAFIPRSGGPRLESTWTAHFRRDGTLVVELRNVGAEGEDYSPTRTTLYGTRAEESGGS